MSEAIGRGGAPAPSRSVGRRPTGGLAVFMLLVCLAGLPLFVWGVLDLRHHHLADFPPALFVLVAVLVAGELLPIAISRGGRSSDEVTISTTFAIALVLVAPLGLVLCAQALPLVFDDVRRRKHWSRPLFNVAQYSLALCAARGAYALSGGHAFLTIDPFTRSDLWPSFAAGTAFFVVNHVNVGAAVALWCRTPVVPQLLEDIRFQAFTSGLLVFLAPLVLVAQDFSVLLVPVLLLPIAAVRRSAQLATAREHDALHDGLTGLPNRTLLGLEMERELEDVADRGTSVAVALVDLDHFKEINDTLGHHVGDDLLIAVAARLRSTLREGDAVARLGGDEFAVLAVGMSGPGDAARLGERVLAALQEPFAIDGVRLDVQASVGIAVAPEHGTDASLLLQRADIALYNAKDHRGRASLYEPSADLHSVQKLALLGDLRQAVQRKQLDVHYQPKCDAATGVPLGVEALVRWTHPRRGPVPPDEFIPIAENTGLIGELTLEVLDQALGVARRMRDEGHPLGVAVNLSVRVLTDLDLPAQVAGLLGKWGVPPQSLTLEVTETSIMVDPVRTMAVLGLLRDLGVMLSIDDFGTGYSSLSYLKRLEAHELKIDRSFISALSKNSNDAVIVRSTIELGHNLGLRLVAEGVEDEQTWQMLKALRCDVVQGYHLSPPLPEERLRDWLAGWPAVLSRPASETPFPLRSSA